MEQEEHSGALGGGAGDGKGDHLQHLPRNTSYQLPAKNICISISSVAHY